MNDSDSDLQLILALNLKCRELKKAAAQGFHLLDTSDNKKISAKEVKVGLSKCGKDISVDRAKQLISHFVPPGGQMNHSQYVRFITSIPKPVLVYWPVHGRSDFCQAMLVAGNVPYELDTDTANSWPAAKEETPFGQIPVLHHGDMTIGQGGAINRYCAKLAGLYPSGVVEQATCDMYLEQIMDIFSGIFKAYNETDKDTKIEKWKMLETEFLPKNFKLLEKNLVASGKPFFGGDEINAADVAFFALYGIYSKASLDMSIAMADCPKLQEAYDATCKFGGLPNFPKRYLYFSSDPSNPAF